MMKNFLYRLIGIEINQAPGMLLFDSVDAANNIAFMLHGDWDGCNGILVDKVDEIAINTAANLIEAKWCFAGASQVVLDRLTTDKLLHRYAIGDRNFINANLRCAELCSLILNDVNFSYAKLNFANLSQTNLSKANFTSADISQANLSHANLSQSILFKTNLQNVNLSHANLRNANLNYACLNSANLSEADLRGAKLSHTDLKGANLDGALF
ncbi:pentapeptide repeat-containing protein [Plectonema cf. radiosum LEGE 06105]|uniref:Pentapeptide repeat-containing protein n=1 Tax=Plectonema cf. radiosum LEGE 06105 TaxID=945769 RepID=A0A8J7JVI4_9CYAN|nr:pentapeptide repeat-containing protein [Plectonema radiosum]MBE9215849.1 pentapeptide repeat-containing protein [Plectonema cf. radiosum LEGE 06105]